ncbi:alpha/beta fold hydrolase [Clostridium fungisolvens]|uniref:2-succinyl-6-hydroxy-2,4-cyclohexadiene-1-carboxylate synthase n=1 Tax=Clostridium fungisolvens TaxID=1604897 RepID=A0A6V8SGN2_9CLOT|nr:alpha/beta hydrolase [Clostridium fungisolvens]GFP76337.1 2-succinyl-6-hydroxy-2,4-cyclohexadiene-1-carboxylate synthase [Clostridium fungisolvens]
MLNDINGEYLKINNSNLFYSLTGEGEPLVFIHGNFNDSRIWDYQIDDFSRNYKVIRYDLRGYGKSDTPISSFSHCEDLKELFDFLKIKDVTVIGSSSGGSVAVDFALQYPELVKALILVAPAINGYRYPVRIMYEAVKSIYLLKSKGFELSFQIKIKPSI